MASVSNKLEPTWGRQKGSKITEIPTEKKVFILFSLTIVTQEGYSQGNYSLIGALPTSLSFLLASKGG